MSQKDIWAEGEIIDRLLKKLQMRAIEQHIRVKFTLSEPDRNRVRMQIKDAIEGRKVRRGTGE